MISGLISTSFCPASSPVVVSITAIRLPMPICGAASPTPLAAYIDSNMSSTSLCSSGVSNSVIVRRLCLQHRLPVLHNRITLIQKFFTCSRYP